MAILQMTPVLGRIPKKPPLHGLSPNEHADGVAEYKCHSLPVNSHHPIMGVALTAVKLPL